MAPEFCILISADVELIDVIHQFIESKEGIMAVGPAAVKWTLSLC
jgi:hypothetical protein